MPDPIIAPMPRAVSDHGPSVLRRRCSGCSDSVMSLSMDLQHSNWLPVDLAAGAVVDDNGPKSPRMWEAGEDARPTPDSYRFACPRASFLTFGFFDPRA